MPRHLYTLILFLIAIPAVAQDITPEEVDTRPAAHVMFGAFGAASLNMHRGVFSTYDGIMECGTFADATTLGWMAGNVLDIPLGGGFAFSPRVYYRKSNGDFTSPNPVSPNVSLADGSLVPLVTEHTLSTAVDYVLVDLLGKWSFAGPLYIAAGPTAGLATRAAYEQEEQIISPNGVTFVNGESTRKIIAGNFDEQGTQNAQRNIHIAATGALGADIPLSSHFVLNPEIGYTFAFTNVLSTFDWKIHSAHGGLALKYMFGAPQTIVIDNPPPAAQAPSAILALEAHNRNADGTVVNYAEIGIAEERLADLMPLLPYVFFDANSSDIPSRYQALSSGSRSSFNETTLRDSVLGIYHNVLNIIGERMTRYPEATISVTGTREPLDDKENTAVSAARAESVKRYLSDVWGIAPARITTTQRALPQVISNRTVDDGRQENRRAEIASNDPRILAPVNRTWGDRSLTPEAVILLPRVQFGDSIRSWNMEVTMPDGARVWSQSGSGVPTGDITWTIDSDRLLSQLAPSTIDHVTATLTTTSSNGERGVAAREIPVRRAISARRISGEIVRDSVLERYALMFFDFNTPNISDFNAQVVSTLQSRMRTNSAVRIIGLTDRIGDSTYNLNLSKGRADASARQIRERILPNSLSATGAGETLIYNNDLPEGRFYNRTVIVEIATPLASS